jgi:general L-amino acid transport system substrate-binding protein
MRLAAHWLLGILVAGGLSQTAAAATLDDVKARGTLRCGVNGAVPGLSYQDEGGGWSGLDVDFCRAVAAGVLGNRDDVEFVPVGLKDRMSALSDGRIDLLARNTTWTLARDLSHGMTFAGILYHDGQGFMVSRDSGLMSTLELGGKRICALAGSTAPDNAKRYFTRHRMELELSTFDDINAAMQAYLGGKCDALTSDQSQLFSLRTRLQDPRSQRVLPEVISKEPLGPAVRKGDDRWFDIVRWTLYLLVDAEELGIDSTNVDRVREQAQGDEARLLLDVEDHTAKLLALEPGWSHRVIRQVGNYSEIFERNLGSQSTLKIKRGLNALWRDGGLLYAPPAR